MKPDPELKKLMFDVVRKQISKNDPEETKSTYERLIKEGYSKEETMQMLASCLVAEMFEVINTQNPYDEARYIATLKNLPDSPNHRNMK